MSVTQIARAFEDEDLQMAYDDSGIKVPLLLVHGFPLDRRIWDPQLEAFGAERRVIAPDLLGFGQSEGSGRESIDAQADALVGLMDRLGVERAVIAGLSMGGYIALAMQRRHALRLAGLVLSNTRAEADSEAARKGRAETADQLAIAGMESLAENMPEKLLSPDADPSLRSWVRDMILRQPTQGSIAALAAMANRPDASGDLSTIVVPTLVCTGAQDRVIPSGSARDMAAAIPGARLVVIPGAGHLSNVEEPGAFNAAVRSLLDAVDGPLSSPTPATG